MGLTSMYSYATKDYAPNLILFHNMEKEKTICIMPIEFVYGCGIVIGSAGTGGKKQGI